MSSAETAQSIVSSLLEDTNLILLSMILLDHLYVSSSWQMFCKRLDLYKKSEIYFFWVLQARSSWLFSLQKIIQTSHPLWDLFLGCFIQIVSSYWIHLIKVALTFSEKYILSVINLWNLSLCWWKHLSGYFTKSVESYIWCCSHTYIYPGM